MLKQVHHMSAAAAAAAEAIFLDGGADFVVIARRWRTIP